MPVIGGTSAECYRRLVIVRPSLADRIVGHEAGALDRNGNAVGLLLSVRRLGHWAAGQADRPRRASTESYQIGMFGTCQLRRLLFGCPTRS